MGVFKICCVSGEVNYVYSTVCQVGMFIWFALRHFFIFLQCK